VCVCACAHSEEGGGGGEGGEGRPGDTRRVRCWVSRVLFDLTPLATYSMQDCHANKENPKSTYGQECSYITNHRACLGTFLLGLQHPGCGSGWFSPSPPPLPPPQPHSCPLTHPHHCTTSHALLVGSRCCERGARLASLCGNLLPCCKGSSARL
jgi:hypothetical protein